MKRLNILLASVFVLPFALFAFGCNQDRGSALSVNKTEFFRGEEIYTTVNYAISPDCWVGLYVASDPINETVDPLRWYYGDRDGWWAGFTYGIQHSAWNPQTRPRLQNLPAGEYKLVLFGTERYDDPRETIYIRIKSEELPVPAAPTEFSYTLDDPADGLAEGTVTLSFNAAAPASEVRMVWADENGALENCTALATVKTPNLTQTFRMTENTIIPEGATRLLAYSVNNAGVSADYAEVALPEGSAYKIDGEPLSSFQVCSDIHINNTANLIHQEHFRMLCNDIAANCPESDGVIAVGDIADTGDPAEWAKMKQIKDSVSGLPEFYFAMGNHDSYCVQGAAMAFGTFKKYAQSDSVYYDRTIKGYHHVFLGQETVGNYADLSDAQLEWFDGKMAEFTAESSTKPVFVYLHQSLYDTVAGSLAGQNWNGVKRNDDGLEAGDALGNEVETKLRAIVAKYPQIVLFNGHSHWDLNSYRNAYERGNNLPTIFNTGSVGYLWESFYAVRCPTDYTQTGNYLEGSQGYYLQVYADKILVFGRDFVQGKYIPSACYEVKL